MKRLFYGLAAIIFAVSAAAFTAPETPAHLTDAYFEFDYDNYTPTLANVEDVSKWKRVLSLGGCPSGEARACKMQVSSDHYDGSSLLSSVGIVASESATGIAFVDDADAVQIINRANP